MDLHVSILLKNLPDYFKNKIGKKTSITTKYLYELYIESELFLYNV